MGINSQKEINSIESISMVRGYMKTRKAEREQYGDNGCYDEDNWGQQNPTESS